MSSAGVVSTELVEAHAARKVQVSGAAFQVAAPAATFPTGAVPEYDGTSWLFTPTASISLYASVPLPVGTRIKTIKWFFDKNSNASALTMRLRKVASDGTITNISTTSDTSSGANPISVTTATIDYTIEDDYQVQLSVSAGATAHAFLFAIITYDRVS
jgi:hypothetical protein